MSPHAVTSHDRKPSVDLSKFGVSRNAFLPATSPPTCLSDGYYEPWELIAQHLPQLIQSNRIRDSVRQLAVLSTDRLQSEEEWRRCYVILAFMMHAYVWGGEEPDEIIPPQITIPFLRASSHLELPPALTYAGANLWNFSCSGTDFSKLEDLTLAVSFTGTPSESWFLLISVAIEAKAGAVLPTMMNALDAVHRRDYDTIASALEDLRSCIEHVSALLRRMHERCDPMVFYHQIRPFLAGSMNMEAAGLGSNGLFYDCGQGQGEWRRYRGGSNGQSSLIHFFDVVLGVDHYTSSSSSGSSFHADVWEYMPGPHRRLLLHVSRMGSIRELALVEPVSDHRHHRLRRAYTAAVDALVDFRNHHIALVTRYIVLPARQSSTVSTSCRRLNLATGSSASCARKAETQLVGTGGTQLIPFLRSSRDDTARAATLQARQRGEGEAIYDAIKTS